MAELYDLSDLEMLAKDCLTRAGVSDAVAAMVARDVALSQAAGHVEGGFETLLRDIRLVRYGRLHPDAMPNVTAPAGVVLHVDAAHGFAAPAIAHALPTLIDLAQREGMALIHLTRASDPGAMTGAMVTLAEAGLAGVALRPQGTAFAVRPHEARVTPFETRSDTLLSSLMTMAPPAADSPLDGPVAQSGWIAALNPAATGVEDLMRGLPSAAVSPTRNGIAVAPELLAQIVNA